MLDTNTLSTHEIRVICVCMHCRTHMFQYSSTILHLSVLHTQTKSHVLSQSLWINYLFFPVNIFLLQTSCNLEKLNQLFIDFIFSIIKQLKTLQLYRKTRNYVCSISVQLVFRTWPLNRTIFFPSNEIYTSSTRL